MIADIISIVQRNLFQMFYDINLFYFNTAWVIATENLVVSWCSSNSQPQGDWSHFWSTCFDLFIEWYLNFIQCYFYFEHKSLLNIFEIDKMFYSCSRLLGCIDFQKCDGYKSRTSKNSVFCLSLQQLHMSEKVTEDLRHRFKLSNVYK